MGVAGEQAKGEENLANAIETARQNRVTNGINSGETYLGVDANGNPMFAAKPAATPAATPAVTPKPPAASKPAASSPITTAVKANKTGAPAAKAPVRAAAPRRGR